MEEQSDGSYLLSGDNGIQYLVPADCEILPFLTRNVVTLQDVQPVFSLRKQHDLLCRPSLIAPDQAASTCLHILQRHHVPRQKRQDLAVRRNPV